MYDCWGGLINQLSSSIDIIGGLHGVISKVNFNAVYSEKNSWSHFGLFVTELSRFRTRLVRHTTSSVYSVYVNFFSFTIGQFVLSRVTLSKGEPYLNPKDSSNQKEKKWLNSFQSWGGSLFGESIISCLFKFWINWIFNNLVKTFFDFQFSEFSLQLV